MTDLLLHVLALAAATGGLLLGKLDGASFVGCVVTILAHSAVKAGAQAVTAHVQSKTVTTTTEAQ